MVKRWKHEVVKAVAVGVASILFTLLFVGMLLVPAHAQENLGVSYSTFFSESGWSIWNMDNQRALQSGSYISALRLGLYNQPKELSGTIRYQVHVQGIGWLNWVENGVETGRADLKEKPIESVRVALSGDLESHYDVYTKVMKSDNKWTAWVKNGADVGSFGAGVYIQGIRITVLPKGSKEPKEEKEIDPSKPMIALTFDDGPSVYTPKFLDVLEKYDARGTFFVLGNNLVERNIPTVQRAVALGNEIGNHTVSHPQLTKKSVSVIRSQIDGVTPKITNLTGKQPSLMRPPYGSYNQEVLKHLKKNGYACILWSIDTLDWKTKNADNTVKVVLEQAKDGDIVLMHDTQGSSANALERIVKGLQDRGYQLVTVSELAMYRSGVHSGKVYSSFRSK